MTDRDMVRELCHRIKHLRSELEPYLPALGRLHGGSGELPPEEVIEELYRDQGVRGAAWALEGSLMGLLPQWGGDPGSLEDDADRMLAALDSAP